MPRPRSAMRKIREVLRLRHAEHLSTRDIAVALAMPRTTVRNYLDRAAEAGLRWPLPADTDDRELEERLFGRAAPPPAIPNKPVPDWEMVHRELRRAHVTLMLLWTEYRERCPNGFGYSWFAERYRGYADRLDVVMRQEHRAGEKLFIDFAGSTIPIVDRHTGVISHAQLFVAALGASSYTYAEDIPSQKLPDWVGAHVRCFDFLGGVPALLIPDNLHSAVKKANRYEADLNRTYEDLADHYGTAVIPARPRKPKDKAKAEAAVQVAQRWILAGLRNRTFFSLAEANGAIRERLDWLNARPFRKLAGSRRSLFESLDRPALRPLPYRSFESGVWRKGTVNIDYHVEVDRHYYSVPYQLIHETADVRISASTVEFFVRGRRVASHVRSFEPYKATTDPAHMPLSHRQHAEWTPERLIGWAAQTGPAAANLVATLMARRPHPELGYRSCLGIIRLGRRYDSERLEAACARALAIDAPTYRSVEAILRAGLDRQPLPAPSPTLSLPRREHANVRGPAYYE